MYENNNEWEFCFSSIKMFYVSIFNWIKFKILCDTIHVMVMLKSRDKAIFSLKVYIENLTIQSKLNVVDTSLMPECHTVFECCILYFDNISQKIIDIIGVGTGGGGGVKNTLQPPPPPFSMLEAPYLIPFSSSAIPWWIIACSCKLHVFENVNIELPPPPLQFFFFF